MLTLATNPNRQCSATGFSLIEVIIVLMLLSLTTAVALPNLTRIYDNFQFKNAREGILQKLESLTLRAYTSQASITLSSDSASELLALPSEWQIVIENPIEYKANGFCAGGEFVLLANGVSSRYTLKPPFCQLAGNK